MVQVSIGFSSVHSPAGSSMTMVSAAVQQPSESKIAELTQPSKPAALFECHTDGAAHAAGVLHRPGRSPTRHANSLMLVGVGGSPFCGGAQHSLPTGNAVVQPLAPNAAVNVARPASRHSPTPRHTPENDGEPSVGCTVHD